MNNPPHPGEILLKEVIYPKYERGSTAAEELDIELVELFYLVNEKRGMSQEIADKLEAAGHGTARAWMALQEAYDNAQRGEE